MNDDIVYLDAQPMEVRSVEKRLISGRIVPYGEVINIRGRSESFAPGALADIDASTVKLLVHHDNTKPIGKMVELEERTDGAHATFRVSKTRRGNEFLELAADGVMAFSPGFYTGEQSASGVHTRIKSMPETSLVTFSAYQGSEVLAVRSNQEEEMEETIVQEATPVVDLAPINTRMDAFGATLERLETAQAAPPATRARTSAPTPLQWFAAQIEGIAGKTTERRDKLAASFDAFQSRARAGDLTDLETRALADVVGGGVQAGDSSPADDLSGLVIEELITSQLVNVLSTRRPMFDALGTMGMPRSGYAKIPTITQHTSVAVSAGQKVEAPSQSLISTNASFEAKWIKGAVDISLEVLATAEMDVLGLVWSDLLGSYAAATESDASAGVVPLIETDIGGTYTGTALDTSTYALFIADVEAQVDVIDDAAGDVPTRLAVTRAQWSALVAMVDANDRRVFSTIGAANADAEVGLTARSFSLPGGIEVFKVKGLTQALLFNPRSLLVADSGPSRVEATNVALMGRDVGVIGRTMLVPRIPAGLVYFGTAP